MWSSSNNRKPHRSPEPDRVAEAALRAAGRRVRSERELAEVLRRRGFAAAAIRQALTICRARGVVDDRAAACLWAETWARQDYSAEAIQARLEAKGFGDAVIRQTAGRLKLSAGDAIRAHALAARQRRTGRARTGRRLAARGFDPDTVTQVLDETFGPSSE